jgi:hypothetical protein
VQQVALKPRLGNPRIQYNSNSINSLAVEFLMAPKLLFTSVPTVSEYEECHLLTIAMESTTMPKKKHTMLPVLVVLFLISYGLLAVLVVEQDRTISAQRSLIQQTMGDSLALTQLKGKIFRQTHPGARPQGKAPSSQADPQEKGSVKSRKLVPLKPPKDAVDTPDARRIPISI